jgi:spermidine synthase
MNDMAAQNDIQENSIFLEEAELEGYYGLALRIDKVVLRKRTKFQDLAVAEAGPLGKILLLDGNVQVAEFDESGYHEMLAHVPLLTHPEPERVLIIGGGDGGTLREVLKHPGIEKVDLCEIDQEVIDASRRFFPDLSVGFDNTRATVHIADGIEFIRNHPRTWDVILVDSSDPVGPAEGIFKEAFYVYLKEALKPGGIAVTQSESAFLYETLIKGIFKFLPNIFPVLGYYNTLVPTYTSGVIGFTFCSLGQDPLTTKPDPERITALGDLDFYTPALHRAAFALPRRFLRLLPNESANRQAVFLNQ